MFLYCESTVTALEKVSPAKKATFLLSFNSTDKRSYFIASFPFRELLHSLSLLVNVSVIVHCLQPATETFSCFPWYLFSKVSLTFDTSSLYPW